MSNDEGSKHLVIIGSSAGGIEALSKLVSTLPTPFPAPIVIAQHVDPRRQSHLPEILSRRSTIPVRLIENGDKIAPGTIYVAPSNNHIEIADHTVKLISDGKKRPTPSVDALLKTASPHYNENLIAVILTGTGSDGSEGAREVKKYGGTVVIQDPETAAYSGMPQSLAPNTVDIVTTIDRMGVILRDLVTGEYIMPDDAKPPEVADILEYTREHNGIDFSQYKMPTIHRRLKRRMVATNQDTPKEYFAYLKAHPDEQNRLIGSFLIKVTEFVRDPELFELLRSTILPEIIDQARKDGTREIRIWSAGCATGEEPYSVAILLSDLLGKELEQFTVRIFATDLDPDAVAYARRGIYPKGSLEDLSPELVARYFTPAGDAYQIRKSVRGLTIFGEHDLGRRSPFPRMDLVLCRNVLIYFTQELQRRTLQLFAFALRRNGYLILGKAETTNPHPEFFKAYRPDLKVYVRAGERVLIPPAQLSHQVTLARPSDRMVPRRSFTELASTHRELQSVRESVESLLQSLPVGVILINRKYDILEINNTARKLLSIHSPALGEDLIHLCQNISHRALRTAVEAAFRGDADVSVRDVKIDTLTADKSVRVDLAFYQRKLKVDEGKGDAVLVLITDVTAMAEKTTALQTANSQQLELAEKLRSAVDELKAANLSLAKSNEELAKSNSQLSASRREAEERRIHSETMLERLSEANRELISSNEKLSEANDKFRSANDELLLGVEEAQASTEEVETLNEELQSSNEELETLNEELQATVEELNTTNADLEARTRELHDLSKVQERFVAMSSHELRTPIVPLQGALELLQQNLQKSSDERSARLADTALTQVKRISHLVNDLMDATRLQTGRFHLRQETVDLSALTQRTAQIAQSFTKKQTIDTDIEAGAFPVKGDPLRLEQVIFNLLTNAINHAADSKKILVSLRRANNEAFLQVEDFGHGIAPESLPQLFSSFYQGGHVTLEQKTSEGLGLGLFICKEIVDAHGGRISVESKEGAGTTFTVVLPLREGAKG